jgi:transcriptional regulator with XRE-family HTH domain
MTVTEQQLGLRIRLARERFHLTPQELGEFVDLPATAIEAIERGDRRAGSRDLLRIAFATGRHASEFFEERFADSGALSALFRADAQIKDRHALTVALQEGIAFALQFASLEDMLGIDRAASLPRTVDLPGPKDCDEAVAQGRRVAADERARLDRQGLLFDRMQHLLETQGVGSVAADLPEEVSGLMLCEPRIGAFVLFNGGQSPARRRFSLAHEYGHVLMDRHLLGSLSTMRREDDLIELRADAFAAEFLTPWGRGSANDADPSEGEQTSDSRGGSLGRLLGLACEAFRRDEISRRKLFEIGRTFGIERDTVASVIRALGLE